MDSSDKAAGRRRIEFAAAIERLGWSQAETARRLGLSLSSVEKRLGGSVAVRAGELAALAHWAEQGITPRLDGPGGGNGNGNRRRIMAYYAVCNVNGPISVRLAADTEDGAVAEFEFGDHQAWIDEPRCDAEDDLGICGDGMTESEMDDALLGAGCRPVRDLDAIANANAGTVAHLDGGWFLWAMDSAE